MTSYILTCMLIGLIANLVMSLFLWLITHLKLCKVNLIKAIGSWYTTEEENSYLPGMFLHLFGDIFFSFVYIFLFSVLPNPKQATSIYVIFGGAIGLVHGMIVALCLIFFSEQNHSLAKFRSGGVILAFYHFLAYSLYGVVVGILYIYLLNARPMI